MVRWTRVGWVLLVVGVAVTTIGYLTLLIPLQRASVAVNTDESILSGGVINGVEVSSMQSPVSVGVTWTADTQGLLDYFLCDSMPTTPSPDSWKSCFQSGSSSVPEKNGALTLSVPSGNYLVLVFASVNGSSANASAHATVAYPPGGILIIAGGQMVLIAGALLVGMGRKAAPPRV